MGTHLGFQEPRSRPLDPAFSRPGPDERQAEIDELQAEIDELQAPAAASPPPVPAPEPDDTAAAASPPPVPAPEPDDQPAEPSQAEIVIRKAGFGQDDESVGWGLVLRNGSETNDAIGVTVTVSAVSRDGNIIKTDSLRTNVIPAGGIYYAGGEMFVEPGDTVADLEAFVDIDESVPAEFVLPQVRHVETIDSDFFGWTVRGEVTNDLGSPLSSFARISVVLFDSRDNIIGGTFAFLDSDLPSGRRAGFETITSGVTGRVARAEASIENELA